VAVVALLLLIAVEAFQEFGISLREKFEQRNMVLRWIGYYIFSYLYLLFMVFGTVHPFIYFQF
jgi:hypothetical protein